MASPQVEDGYTRIANELLEALMLTKLSPAQHRIVMAIIRYTYGFNRCEASLSVTFLAKAVDRTEKNTAKDLRQLIERNIITIAKEQSKTESRVIKLNKDYEGWMSPRNQPPLVFNPPSKLRGQPPSKSTPKKDNYKDNYKDIVFSEILEHWNLKNIIVHRSLSSEISSAIEKALKIYKQEEIIKYIDRYETALNDDAFYYSYKWTLANFLVRKGNGIKDWTDEGQIWVNYLKSSNGKAAPAQMRTSIKIVGELGERDG